MSNLNTHGVVDYATAKAALAGKSARTLCYATTLQVDAVGNGQTAIVVRHHGSPIIRYFDGGRVDIRNAGWLSRTTTDRLHRMTPDDIMVSFAKGGHVSAPLYVGPQSTDWQCVA